MGFARLVPALAAAALGGLVLSACAPATPQDETRRLPVSVVAVEPQDSYESLRLYAGRVEAGRRALAGFEIPGLVSAVAVDEGASVAAGAPLARLDTALLDAARREAEAGLAEAEAAERLARATLERVRAAVETRAASRQQLDEAEQGHDAARAARARAAAALESIEVRLSKSTLRAPFDARVAARFVDEGQVIEAGAPVLDLVETGAPEARIGVAEAAAEGLAPGDAVTLRRGAERLPAEVVSVAPVRDPAARTVDVRVALAADAAVRPGDLVELERPASTREPGFWAPLSALAEGSRGLWAVYAVVEDGEGGFVLERRDVVLIHEAGERAYVRGPLQAGERIVAAGLHRAAPGLPVRLAEDAAGRESGA